METMAKTLARVYIYIHTDALINNKILSKIEKNNINMPVSKMDTG